MMDVVLARTFLAVIEGGSFVEAAARVHVTQSTISTRIRTLEARLGKTLFERGKAGATLTAAGMQFQKHAQALVRVWEQARLEVALPPGYDAALTVGGSYSLWDGFLLPWLSRMRRTAPGIAIRTQVGPSGVLMQRLVEGVMDIAVMYTPERRPGFEVELLFEEHLVLVTSEIRGGQRSARGRADSERGDRGRADRGRADRGRADRGRGDRGPLPGRNYVYIDWGPEFQADHSLNFPDLSTPGLYMELGSLSLEYLLSSPASGYVPRRLVARHLAAGTLKLLPQAPAFSYPAYMVYPLEAGEGVASALKALRRIAAALPAG